MTTKHLSGYYPGGYTLSTHYRKLVIDKTARVAGYGVDAPSFATLVNGGTVYGYERGVYLESGGSLINGSATNTSASISSGFYGSGVIALGGATIANFGTIAGVHGDGVALQAGGSITNGSTRDTTALIIGYDGAFASGAIATTIANFGTIGSAGFYADGVYLGLSGSLTNGAALDTTALITGYEGVSASGAAAVIVNFGTIEGTGGVSVALYGSGGEVIAEAGSAFIGAIDGGGGTLSLAGDGTGTISGLGVGGTLTGAVNADFSGFSSLVIEAGGTWTLAGPSVLNANAVLVDEGTLINRGALTLSGTVSIGASAVFRLASGNISGGPTDVTRIIDDGLVIKSAGRGMITVDARTLDDGGVEVATGTLDFTSHLLGTGVLKIDEGGTLEADAAAVSTLSANFNGAAAMLALKTPNAFDATISGFATGDTIDLLAIKATGASVNGSDQMVIVDGARTVATLQLSGKYAGATFTTTSDGHGGTNIELAPDGRAEPMSVATPHALIAAMAAFGGTAGGHTAVSEPWTARGPMLCVLRVVIA